MDKLGKMELLGLLGLPEPMVMHLMEMVVHLVKLVNLVDLEVQVKLDLLAVKLDTISKTLLI